MAAERRAVTEADAGPEPGARQRWLLVAGIPLRDPGVGGVVLRDIAAQLGPDSVYTAAVLSPRYGDRRPARASGSGLELVSPFRRARRQARSPARSLLAYAMNFLPYRKEVRRLARELRQAAVAHEATAIFAVLDHPIMVSVIHELQRLLQLPMVSLVWDSPDHQLQQAKYDHLSAMSVRRSFRACLQASSSVAVVSEAMQREFRALTSAPVQILRHGIDSEVVPDGGTPTGDDEWLIGFSGSLYAESAWLALLSALDQASWRVAGRPVRLRVLSARVVLASRAAARVEYLGFMPTEQEAQAAMSACHVTYLPQPFENALTELSRYSFPTKLTSYLGHGRPVLVHAPKHSAIAEFCREHPVGGLVDTLDATAILTALESLLGGADAYAEASRRAQLTARELFSGQAFRNALTKVLAPIAGARA